jgi:L-amino acid N-acyltransferase YncA
MIVYATTEEMKVLGASIMKKYCNVERIHDSKYLFCLDEETKEVRWCCCYESFMGLSCHISIANLKNVYMHKELLKAVFEYPFIDLGLELLIATVFSSNKTSMRYTPRFGFKEKLKIPKGAADGSDFVVFAMYKNDCKFLGDKDGSK